VLFCDTFVVGDRCGDGFELRGSAARSLDGQSFLSLSAARFYSGLLAPPSPLPSCPVMYLVDVFNLPLGKLPALETAA